VIRSGLQCLESPGVCRMNVSRRTPPEFIAGTLPHMSPVQTADESVDWFAERSVLDGRRPVRDGDGDAPVRGVRSSGTRTRPYCATASSPPRTVEGHSGSGVRKRYTMMKWLLATLAGKKPNIDRVGLSTCCWARRGSYTSLISSADVATPLWVIPVAKGSDGIRAVPAK
jgi:hypothetical protein